MGAFKEQLEKGKCGNPECKETHGPGTLLFFRARCHPEARTKTFYTLGSGVVSVVCAECEKTVIEIEVASREPQIGLS